MIKLAFILFLFFLQGKIVMAQSLNELKVNIENRFTGIEGNYAVAFYNFEDGGKILINEKENFHAASTMKTPIMLEIFKQHEEGKLSLNDSVIIKNEFKSIVDSSIYSMDLSEDSGENLYEFIGRKRTIRELVYDMITVSSNLATNILIEFAGAKNVMETMKQLGADDIKVLRGVEDIKAFRLGMNNTVTACDLMLLFKAIEQAEIVSAESSKEMIKILSEQKFKDRIPAKLPSHIKVAHKTGWITGVGHDSGIVYLPDGRKYILILLSKNVKDDERMKEAQNDVSKMIFDHLTK